MNVTIREVTQDTLSADLPAIARVHLETWHTTYTGIIPQAYLDSLTIESRLAMWQRGSANIGLERRLFVAVQNEQIVGFADCGKERNTAPDFDGELYGFYILEPYQKRGIGKQLLAAIQASLRSRGFKNMLVWVFAENPSAAFYERTGGKKVREQYLEIGGANLLELGYGYEL
jgi:ribosomal protein S18 acetylase RimI-like enzyme